MKKRLPVFFVFALLLGCFTYFYHPFLKSGGIAHVSIDDVTTSFQNLTKDSMKYDCLFEEPFFSYLKELHDKYGSSFTCYAYEQDSSFNINQMPVKFAKEFESNSDWLKIGFHGVKPSIHTPNNISYSEFTKSFSRFNKELDRFASIKKKPSILRLDFFYATTGEVDFLVNNGVKVLLSADDDRRSYYLPINRNRQLIKDNSVNYKNLKYLRTNIRIENIDIPYINLLRNRRRDTLVIFTHEWKLNKINRYKLNRTLSILKDQNYIFIAE